MGKNFAADSGGGPGIKGTLVYGGSFNPPHIAHMRLAVEARERLGALVDRVEFLPSFMPPHKKSVGILPFALRARMLAESIAGCRAMLCNTLEWRGNDGRNGPSFTFDTLNALREREPGRPIYFLLGSRDFTLLPAWKRGLELPGLCTLVVAPRENLDAEGFLRLARTLWPEARPAGQNAAAVPGLGEIIFLPSPHLPVSASLVREMWLAGKSVRYLVPPPVERLLEQENRAVRACWLET